MAELLAGCGNNRKKVIAQPGKTGWADLTTLDIDPNCGADIEWDLERMPLPFADNQFDEVHCYHVLEHLGRQGDWRFFFAQFSEFWRILKPDGVLCGIVPSPASPWVWGDPGHVRHLPPEIFTFLDQTEYERQIGVTAFADYRHVYKADFQPVWKNIDDSPESGGQFFFALQAIKPSRCKL